MNNNIGPGNLIPQNVAAFDQDQAVLDARKTLRAIARATPGGYDARAIDSLVTKMAPEELPGLVQVLRNRTMLDVLQVPHINVHHGVPPGAARPVVEAGATVLGPGDDLIRNARHRGNRRHHVEKIQAGAGHLKEKTGILVNGPVRRIAKESLKTVESKARHEQAQELDALGLHEREILAVLWARISNPFNES